MSNAHDEPSFRGVFSLSRLIRFWKDNLATRGGGWALLFQSIEEQLAKAPELLEPVEDLSILEPHEDLIGTLMSAVFPPAFWGTEAVGAVVPFSLEAAFVSPLFKKLLLNEDGTFCGRMTVQPEVFAQARQVRLNLLILRTFYGMTKDLNYPMTRIVQDPDTGLDRYFKFKPDLRFVEVRAVAEPRQLSDTEKTFIVDHLAEPGVFRHLLPPENFEFHGFTVVHAVDMTQSEVIAELERDAVDREALFSDAGFERLQTRLRTLFRRPDLTAGLAAIQGDRVLLLNSGCRMECNCIFSDSRHVDIREMNGSVFHRAVEERRILVIRDLMEEPTHNRLETEILASGKRSLLIAPLFHQGELIGTLDLTSPQPGDLGPMDELLATQIQPLFSMALKRALDELDNQVDSVIKQKCTAVHPSVEWRFRNAVLDHLERTLQGQDSELEPIVFKDVYPLYGATDIRGSSEGRNRAIQEDLCDHLALGLEVVKEAWSTKSLPFLGELSYRTANLLERIRTGLGTGDELTVVQFLRKELEPFFPTLQTFGSRVEEALRAYEAAVDPHLGTVYRKRRDFEDSVSQFNQRLSAYLEREQVRAQSMFPHYFEKHQTDGLEYVMYVGSSMAQNGSFNQLYLKSLRLWQVFLACGIAWHAEQLKSELKVPLSATHLILAHHSPLAVRFRFDEKRFDVDGAYDVGHEIVRSRIDKAIIKATGGERLTQPGRIAIVYSQPEESQEMVRHIHFLQNRDFLLPDHEALELEDLPGVQGLRALRVSVNVNSAALAAKASGGSCNTELA